MKPVQHYLLNNLSKTPSEIANQKVEICLETKTPRAQILPQIL